MLGGGHVCHQSMDSVVDASPCVQVEKRKHSELRGIGFGLDEFGAFGDSPNKARIVDKPSIASTSLTSSMSSFAFGDEHMIKAQQGLLEWQSLEDSCLIADGEDLSGSCMFYILGSRINLTCHWVFGRIWIRPDKAI